MIRRTWIARLSAAAIAIAATAGTADAGLLPVSVTVQPEAGNFRWTYAVVLPSDMKLQSGNYFTIYDFAGYQAGSASVSSAGPDESFSKYWTVSTSNLGPTPNLLNPQDDPSIANLTFTYNGGPTLPIGDPQRMSLGNFVATSLYGSTTGSFFTATNPQVSTGDLDSNIIATLVPKGTDLPPPTFTPEPTTLVLAGLGLPLLGLGRAFRRKAAPAAV